MESGAFTGERPGWGKDFDYDEARHLAAYGFAYGLADGLTVMDAGCGEGFGTQTLATSAARVLGIDYNEGAIAFCGRRWDIENLSFRHLDLCDVGSFDETFDLVLNFQVVEHIENPRPFLEGLRDRLKPDGRLVLTTPNRLRSFSENPYHVREYTADELRQLLEPVFSRVEILGMHGNAKVEKFDRGREKSVKRILRLDPLGLRNLLPQSVINFAFAKLAVLVRRQARADAQTVDIAPEDFEAREGQLDEALDLIAICRP